MSDSLERNQLAKVVEDSNMTGCGCCAVSDPSEEQDVYADTHSLVARDLAVADAVLAAGYRKPREVTTTEELDALPVGSVVKDSFKQRVFHRWGLAGWQCAGMTFKAEIVLPATVLWEPNQ